MLTGYVKDIFAAKAPFLVPLKLSDVKVKLGIVYSEVAH